MLNVHLIHLNGLNEVTLVEHHIYIKSNTGII